MFSGRRLCGPYLQVASGRGVVDLDIGGVNVRQLESVSQPRNRHIAGVSQHFTADVGRVALPRVHRYWSQDFRGICDERQSIYNWKTNKPASSSDPLSTYRPSTSAKGEQNLHSHYLWSLNSEDKVFKDQNVHGLNIELKAECLKHSALRCWTHLFVAIHKSQSRFTGFKRPLLQAASLNSTHRGLLQAQSSWRGPAFPHRLCANNCQPAEILFSHSSEIQMSLVPTQQYTAATNAQNKWRGRLVFSQHTPPLMWKQIQTGAVGGAQWEWKWVVMLCLLLIAIKKSWGKISALFFLSLTPLS